MNSKVNELQVLEQNSNAIVEAFKTEGGAKALFDRIAEQARSVVPDLSTDKGRKAIASMARKVASTKTAFDAHGKELKEQYTVITNKIDADRKLFRDSCDALRDEIRKPLTDWEQAETDRVAKHQAVIRAIHSLHDENIANKESHEIKGYIFDLENTEIDSSFEEFEQEAKIAKFETLEKLRTALAAREKYEDDQAELQRLQREEAERQQRERDAAIAKQAAEQARIEAENKAKAEREQAEKLARESAEREANLKAQKEAAELREAQLKQQAIEQAKQAEIKQKQAIEAERKRIEDEQAAQLKAQQEAEAARLANVEHMRAINNQILNKLCEIGLDEGQAKAVITAIAKNQIPHISVKY
ncbi:colicin import membrane protein [Acinetobacter baylyi]|uniref:Colicin import membrane protein n=1 Tax=Acinetobacter baylyi TaxID=202950 RepID=A0ABU0URQ4_ACIBI|nr:hypothetical protein [Acinetobacter baylyi]MDQ1207235.1 colicin import membrane protein [Acinetobacter baylyi]MDR6105684.1 colicin import membrane protein [Acinetobacter baylyi]MDR6187596.1 colicin import membrane protein [Acinetobacter baylyi]